MGEAVQVKKLGKRFRILYEKQSVIRNVLPNLFKLKDYDELWALKDVTFSVNRGETFGIIGRNASGKSTLLRILAGITHPTEGELKTNGKISTLLELGAGFQHELTGMENIFLNATILGLNKKEIIERIERIIDFSELGDFINTRVKVYSSGMYVRLGFAIAIHADFDILLVDEVLAVGDASFQKKCLSKIKEFKDRGKTIVMVSHNMDAIATYCDRVLWLEKGTAMDCSSPEPVIRHYQAFFSKPEAAQEKRAAETLLPPSKKRVLKALKAETPDRVPLEIWLFDKGLKDEIVSRYGSKESFYDTLRIDLETVIIPPPYPLRYEPEKSGLNTVGWDSVLDFEFPDPDDPRIYNELQLAVKNAGAEKAVIAHVWGVFEGAAYMVGFQNLLLQMRLNEKKVLELFHRLKKWNSRVAEYAIDCGADALSVSEDIAGYRKLLIDPEMWRKLILPQDVELIDLARKAGLPVSLHSHGYIEDILDDIVEMGVNAIHPIGTYAGVDAHRIKAKYGAGLCFRGGLDIGFSLENAKDGEAIAEEVREIMSVMKVGGGFIFGTNFAIEKGIALEKLTHAYNVAWEYGRYG